MRWLAQLLVSASRAAVNQPRRTLALWVAAAVAAVGLAYVRLDIRTSNLDLIDPQLPPVARFLDFARTFGNPNLLVVALEGGTPEARRNFAGHLTARLTRRPDVRLAADRLPLPPDLVAELGLADHFASRDGSTAYVFVQPAETRSELSAIEPFLRGVREAIAEIPLAAHGIQAGLTGIPQYALDDQRVVQRDVRRLSQLSLLLVAAVFRLGFHRVRHPLCAVGALLPAVAVTTGWIALVPGHLTLLSASFASILFGLGVDYGIHILNRFEARAREGEPVRKAAAAAVADVAPDITTGAFSTAAVFASLLACGFRGFAELGQIAAVGVLLCLVAMCTALPALLALFPGPPTPVPASTARSRLEFALCPSFGLAIVLLALALAAGGSPGFDSDYLDLQPADSETVRLERGMARDSDASTQFAAFLAPDAARAQALAERLFALPDLVAEVRSATELAALAPQRDLLGGLPAAHRQALIDAGGRHAVYAYPAGNPWDPAFRARLVAALQAIDPEVTGMPVLGEFLMRRSEQAYHRALVLGVPLLILLVGLDLRRPALVLPALVPTLLTFPVLMGTLAWLDLPLNPLSLMALPVILGIAVDDGVHLAHRFRAWGGDLAATLRDAGRGVSLTTATTLAAFACLALADHRGLRAFAVTLALGVTIAYGITLAVTPWMLRLLHRHLPTSPHD
jgi:predicted RND superfamily exporter protein